MYYTYIIKSISKDLYYIGQTNNLEDRIYRHNHNRNKYTKGKGPWKLVFSKTFECRSDAVQLEQKLKSFRNISYLERWIDEQKS
jgi:putative endonuclease